MATEWTTETAEWYAAHYGEYATNSLAVDALDLPANAVIVDVGCGAGPALRHASQRVTTGALIGVDPVPRMVEIAQARAADHPAAARLEFRVGSAESLPVDDGVADFVFAFDSFDHWQDKAAGLAEVRRILRPAGQLVVVKDGGVPGGAKAAKAFVKRLTDAGFALAREETIEVDEVSFTLWICSLPESIDFR
ncbi:MAG: methyltransferase domain-containing protein [Caldilineaceae bacterium]|nr:methyltransferase domain-containing protein [Caldilineaceae bacterium]